MSPTEQYHHNWIIACYRVMAESGMNQSEFAAWLGVNRVSVYKITDRQQAPTVAQGITLCLKGGISADWLFLNKGTLELQNVPERVTHKAPTS